MRHNISTDKKMLISIYDGIVSIKHLVHSSDHSKICRHKTAKNTVLYLKDVYFITKIVANSIHIST